MQSILLILLNQALILWIRANFVWRGTNMKFSSFNSHPNKTSAGKQWKMKPRSLERRSYPYAVKRNQSLRMPISHNTPLSTEKQRTRARHRNEIRVRRIETETAAWYWLVRQSHATGLFLRPAKLIGGCDCMKWPDRTPCGMSSPAEVPPPWTVLFTNGSWSLNLRILFLTLQT